MLSMSTHSTAAISQLFLWVAIIVSSMILIPQIVKMHKNRYAGTNTSVFMFAAYLVANFSWAIYQLTYNLSSNEPHGNIQYVLIWIQFGGYAVQALLGLYSFIIKLYFMIGAKDKKNNILLSLVQQRAHIARLINGEKEQMKQVTYQLIEQYPKLRAILEKQCERKNITLEKYLNQKTSIELTVLNASFMKKILNTKFNPLDENIDAVYNKYSQFVDDKIDELSVSYLDKINELYHYRANKLPLSKLRKTPKTQQDLDQYLQRIDLVDKWMLLCKIYQSLSTI